MGEAVAIEKPRLGDFFGNRRGRRRNRRLSPYRVGKKWLPLRQTASGPQVNFNARLYDPALGRFLSVDPLIAHPGSTQSINPYSYVENNPLNKTDPTGMASAGACPNKDQCVTVKYTQTGSHIQKTAMLDKTTGTFVGKNALPGGHSIALSTDGNARLTVSKVGGAGQGAKAATSGRTNNNLHNYDGMQRSDAGPVGNLFPEGAPIVTIGKDLAAFGALINGLITGDETIQTRALDVLKGSQSNNVNALIILGTLGRGRIGAAERAALKSGFVGEGLKSIRIVRKGRLKGFMRGNTELPGGLRGAQRLFKNLTGRFPEGGRDRVILKDGREIQFRTRGKSGTPKIEIVDPKSRVLEKISFPGG